MYPNSQRLYWLAVLLLTGLFLLGGSPPTAQAQGGTATCNGDDLAVTWNGYTDAGVYFIADAGNVPVGVFASSSGNTTFNGPGTWTNLRIGDAGLGGFFPLGSFTCPAAGNGTGQTEAESSNQTNSGPPIPAPDADSDGVPDAADLCPNQGSQGNGVDANGCPNNLPNPLSNWEGNLDGRLNPSAAEYYTVFCANAVIEVYRADGTLLKQFPIQWAYEMDPAGSTYDLGDGMTLARSNDSLTIGGTNGNAAPDYGEKRFSLTACARAGGYIAEMPQAIQAAFSVEQAFTSRFVGLINNSQGVITSVMWNFGDGTTSNAVTPPQHEYTQSDIYTIRLTVSGPAGSSTAATDILVYIDTVNPEPEAPLASFTMNPILAVNDGLLTLGYEFIDASIGDVNTWLWEIDGSRFHEGQNPPPYYRPPGISGFIFGNETVSLTITGPGGSDTFTLVLVPPSCLSFVPPLSLGPLAWLWHRWRKRRRNTAHDDPGDDPGSETDDGTRDDTGESGQAPAA